MAYELLIQNGDKVYQPAIEGDITWKTERKGYPGELKFNIIQDDVINVTEGNAVRLKKDGSNIFYGFIFSKSSDKEKVVTITAYDQLRYFKNKDTYVYENKTAGELIKMLANDFNMQTGTIEDTGYKIASRVEENATLFDMVQNALDLTVQNKKEMYVMYDDFGKIALKNIASMVLDCLVDEETAENYSYKSSIDENTYNKIKLVRENEETGKRDVFIAQSSSNMNQWGVLQYFDTLQDGENGQSKVNALLELYNKKTRNLSIKKMFGDVRVRAGCLIPVKLNLGDVNLLKLMLVEKCTHTFKESEHFMDITLKGGEFVA
jgi:hypothetical protein